MFSCRLQTFPRFWVPNVRFRVFIGRGWGGGWCSYLETPNTLSPLIHVTATARQGWIFFESHEYFTCVKIGFYCEQWLRRNNGELLERGNFHKRNVIQILRGDLEHQSKKTFFEKFLCSFCVNVFLIYMQFRIQNLEETCFLSGLVGVSFEIMVELSQIDIWREIVDQESLE